jgi:hypothetical protein
MAKTAALFCVRSFPLGRNHKLLVKKSLRGVSLFRQLTQDWWIFLSGTIVGDSGAARIKDITIARLYGKVWLICTYTNLASLSWLCRTLGIVANAVLSAKLFGNVCEGKREILCTVCLVSSASCVLG